MNFHHTGRALACACLIATARLMCRRGARRSRRLPFRSRAGAISRTWQKQRDAPPSTHAGREAGDRRRHLPEQGRYGTGQHADHDRAGEGDAGLAARHLHLPDRARHGRDWILSLAPRCRARPRPSGPRSPSSSRSDMRSTPGLSAAALVACVLIAACVAVVRPAFAQDGKVALLRECGEPACRRAAKLARR